MLQILRSLNNHPFVGVLKMQGPSSQLDICDVPEAIKIGEIAKTSHFEKCMNKIFKGCQEHINQTSQEISKIITKHKIEFIK